MVVGIVVTVICWLPAAGSDGHPTSALRAGVLAFLTANHGGVVLDGVDVAFVPMGMTLILVAIAWHAGGLLADLADELGVANRSQRVEAVLIQAACYALVCAVLIPIGTVGASQVRAIATVLAAFVLCAVVAGCAMARASGAFESSPTWARNAGQAAVAATAVLLAGGALLIAVSLALHSGRVTHLSSQVGGGLSGVPVLVIGVLAAPNAVVGASSYLAGPGFAVGSGTTFTLFTTAHGMLPAFPVLGAVPAAAANAMVLAWAAIVLVGAAAAAAAILLRESGPRLRAAGLASAGAGLMMAVLAWLAGGGIGERRLRTVGASAWQLGLAVAGELAVLIGLILAGTWLLSWWRARHVGGKGTTLSERENSEEPKEHEPKDENVLAAPS